jgi:hypothetical protein
VGYNVLKRSKLGLLCAGCCTKGGQLLPSRSYAVALAAMALVMVFAAGCGSDPQPTFTLAPAYSQLFPNSDAATPSATPTGASSQGTVPSPTGSAASSDSPPTEIAQPVDPVPTATLVPSSASATPTPVMVWLGRDTPQALTQAAADVITSQAERYRLTDDVSVADVRIGGGVTDGRSVATWVYALVAPFPLLVDGVTWDELRGAWSGTPSGSFAGRPLLMTDETLSALKAVLGEPAAGAVVTVPETELLTRAWADQMAWAIVPFEALGPRWKVLRLDGVSPLDQGWDLASYALVTRVSAAGASEMLEPFLAAANLPASNRDEARMTSVLMTGVTALTRATAWRMEQNGMTYPARDVGEWLRNADITHVSNEVSFDPECGPPNPVQEGLLFCSDPRYIELLAWTS